MKSIFLADVESEILESKMPVLLKLGRHSCPLCRGMNVVFLELEYRFRGKIKLLDLDLDANPEATKMFEIDGVPTVFFFKDGNAIEVPYPENPSILSGYDKEYLIEYLEKVLK